MYRCISRVIIAGFYVFSRISLTTCRSLQASSSAPKGWPNICNILSLIYSTQILFHMFFPHFRHSTHFKLTYYWKLYLLAFPLPSHQNVSAWLCVSASIAGIYVWVFCLCSSCQVVWSMSPDLCFLSTFYGNKPYI